MTEENIDTTTPPSAAKISHLTNIHGITLRDDYHWMREKTDSKVIAHLNAENDYTSTIMKPTEELQNLLYLEMRSRIKETDITEFDKNGDYFYYSRTESGKQYPIYCRQRNERGSSEETLLDVNELAAEHSYFTLGTLQISPDQSKLAYSYETDGSEHYSIAVKTLATGEVVDSGFKHSTSSVIWLNDNKRLLYVVQDSAFRPYKVMLHALGSHTDDDVVLYEEQNEAFHIDIDKSSDLRYAFIYIQSKTTTEILYAQADDKLIDFKIFMPRQNGIEYSLDHNSGVFYIRTNDSAKNFRLLAADANNVSQKREIVPQREKVKLSWMHIFDSHIVIGEREDGMPHIAIIEKKSGEYRRIKFADAAYHVAQGRNFEVSANFYRCKYSSPIMPPAVFDISFSDGSLKEVKRQEILGGFDSAKYKVERVFAIADDGTSVPMTLLYGKDIKKDGKNPTLLYGYGSYGASMPDNFRSNLFSLIDRGFIYALAHIRGGGEMGEYWYDEGKLLHKRNTFTDFIACAEFLINNGYASTNSLSCQGGSAGGLLIGATLNLRPDLFAAAIADVPFVDMINTMLDSSLPLTVFEYEEWGNPMDPLYFDYMRSYSPYDNITIQNYPHILAVAGLNDPRVQYWEPAKWVAKLRELKTNDNIVMLKTNMSSGHFGASGRFEYLKMVAFEYAFLIHFLGK